MSQPPPVTASASALEPAAYLDMPKERRTAAIQHAALLGVTMRKLAADVPFQADVDDIRRVLIAEAK